MCEGSIPPSSTAPENAYLPGFSSKKPGRAVSPSHHSGPLTKGFRDQDGRGQRTPTTYGSAGKSQVSGTPPAGDSPENGSRTDGNTPGVLEHPVWVCVRLNATDGDELRELLVDVVLINVLATALHIRAGFGPGARDGLMTGLVRRGHSLWRARTVIEGVVLIAGLLLGGTAGIGTVVYACAIGPLTRTRPMRSEPNAVRLSPSWTTDGS